MDTSKLSFSFFHIPLDRFPEEYRLVERHESQLQYHPLYLYHHLFRYYSRHLRFFLGCLKEIFSGPPSIHETLGPCSTRNLLVDLEEEFEGRNSHLQLAIPCFDVSKQIHLFH